MFTYLSQFRLNVRYKLKKQYIISNALFKFLFNVIIKWLIDFDSNFDENILNIIYYIILMKIFDDFKIKLKQKYQNNKK